jgi:NAD(P)-dependent dehydrogenase (short-subunit alcohol dehydrogenase family)
VLLEGRTAIITGVGPGLGRAMALLFAREGADVALAARSRERLEAIAGEVAALGRRALAIPTDISDPAQAKNCADTAFAAFGKIDVLVNSAFAHGVVKHLVTMDAADLATFLQILKTNVWGTMLMCRYTAPYMIEAKRGVIINITTVSMRQGRENSSAYSSSKAAVAMFSQSLASELGPHGIRVNCVVPGHIWSDNLKGYYETRARATGRTYAEQYAQFTGEMALRRVPEADEVAAAVLFMASDLASAITGQSLDVNAGYFFH